MFVLRFLLLTYIIRMIEAWMTNDVSDIKGQLILGTFLFVFVLFATIFERLEMKKDSSFQGDGSKKWQTSLRTKLRSKEKKLFKGEKLIFTYKRIYFKKWHQWKNDILYGHMYSVNIIFKNEDKCIEWKETKAKEVNREQWDCFLDGELVTTAQFTPKLQEVVRTRDKIEVTFNEQLYTIIGPELNGEIYILKNNEKIGQVQTQIVPRGNIEFSIQDENELFIATAVIVFLFKYRN